MSKQAVLRELSDRRLLNDVAEDLHDEIATALIEAVREGAGVKALRIAETALERADQFIANGRALGFIRMPDVSTPDPAHETPSIIEHALETVRSALSPPEADAQQPCPASALLAFLGQASRTSVDDLYFQGGIRRSEIESRLAVAVADLVEERDTALRQAEDQWAGWIKADCRIKALREALQYVIDNDAAYLKAPSDPPPKGYPGHLAGVARAAIERDGGSQKVQEPVYKQVERILDEHSAWVGRPNREVAERIALAATIAAMTVLAQEGPE